MFLKVTRHADLGQKLSPEKLREWTVNGSSMSRRSSLTSLSVSASIEDGVSLHGDPEDRTPFGDNESDNSGTTHPSSGSDNSTKPLFDNGTLPKRKPLTHAGIDIHKCASVKVNAWLHRSPSGL